MPKYWGTSREPDGSWIVVRRRDDGGYDIAPSNGSKDDAVRTARRLNIRAAEDEAESEAA